MADTFVKNPKLIVGTQAQVEAEMGANDIGFATDVKFYTAKQIDELLEKIGGANLPILTRMWSDHVINDMSWLRADTFSWQSGDVYVAAYDHLAGELMLNVQLYAWLGAKDDTLYTYSETPQVGDPIVDGDGVQKGTIVSVDGTSLTTTITNSNPFDRRATQDFELDLSKTDTVGDITITYYLAQDGHKICLPDQESNIVALYETTGVAWYYILDTANKQFKLPRSKHNKYADTVPVVGNGLTLGLTDGTTYAGLADRAGGQSGSHLAALAVNAYGVEVGGERGNAFIDSGKTVGVTTDPEKSGIIAKLGQDTDQYKYLYFYVGNFERDAVEQTAGINAEMFNGKADRNLMNTTDNVDIVIESQFPTAENGYTWYRKYKSGWVEQGGYDSTTFGTRTWNYPVEMQDEGYTLALSVGYDSISSQNGKFGITERTTTGFSYQVISLSGNATGKNMSWYVCGMSA